MRSNKNIIFVTSYPKSGATWFQFLIYSCYKGSYRSSRQVLRFYPPANRTHLIEQSAHKPLFIKSHSTFSEGLPYLNADSKIILIVRHPLDISLSLINHHLNQGSLRLLLPYFKQRFLHRFLEDNKKQTTDSWCFHLKTWLEQDSHPLHIIKYEDLIEDTAETLIKLRNAYNLEFDDQAIASAVSYCSLRNMKALEANEFKNKTAGLFYSKRRNLTRKLLKTSFVNKGGMVDKDSFFTPRYLEEAAAVFDPLLDF